LDQQQTLQAAFIRKTLLEEEQVLVLQKLQEEKRPEHMKQLKQVEEKKVFWDQKREEARKAVEDARARLDDVSARLQSLTDERVRWEMAEKAALARRTDPSPEEVPSEAADSPKPAELLPPVHPAEEREESAPAVEAGPADAVEAPPLPEMAPALREPAAEKPEDAAQPAKEEPSLPEAELAKRVVVNEPLPAAAVKPPPAPAVEEKPLDEIVPREPVAILSSDRIERARRFLENQRKRRAESPDLPRPAPPEPERPKAPEPGPVETKFPEWDDSPLREEDSGEAATPDSELAASNLDAAEPEGAPSEPASLGARRAIDTAPRRPAARPDVPPISRPQPAALPRPAAAFAPPPLPEPPRPGPALYRVQKGDTLPALARRIYGDPSRWTAIYEANRYSILRGLIEPGQWILIPTP
jgi:hypothetical protein